MPSGEIAVAGMLREVLIVVLRWLLKILNRLAP
jgi:hypothetical protein